VVFSSNAKERWHLYLPIWTPSKHSLGCLEAMKILLVLGCSNNKIENLKVVLSTAPVLAYPN